MADYWISRKKWTCKYCDVTINDDLPSRQQHEGGFRHKNNVERALRDLYRKSEQEKRDQEKVRREMVQIEKLAREAHKDDLLRASGSQSNVTDEEVVQGEARSAEVGSTSTIKSAPSAAPAPAPAPTTTTSSWNPSDRLTAYGSAAADEARRIVAEEEERLRMASEAVEAARREGVAGEWQVVQEEEEPKDLRPPRAFASSRSDMDQTERQRARGFKLMERTAPIFDEEEEEGERGDSTSLPTIKVKKRIKVQGTAESIEESRRRMLPQWTSLSLHRADSMKKEEDQDVKPALIPVGEEEIATTTTTTTTVRDPESAVTEANVKPEQGEVLSCTAPQEAEKGDVHHTHRPAVPTSISTTPSKTEDASEEKTTNGGMFRKRKVGAGAGSKKVRMF